jgi:hypothetical protein
MGFATNNEKMPSADSTAVTGEPGVEVPVCGETGDHIPQPPAGLFDTETTLPSESVRKRAVRPSWATMAVTGAPGLVMRCPTLVQLPPQPSVRLPEMV